jgi:hypothetical protein
LTEADTVVHDTRDELTGRAGHGYLAMFRVGMANHIVQRFEHHQISPLLNCRR